MGDGEAFDLKKKIFALIDLNMISEDDNSDSSKMISRIQDVDEYKSIEEVIHFQCENAQPNQKFIYKMMDNASTNFEKFKSETYLEEIQNRFIAIKVK